MSLYVKVFTNFYTHRKTMRLRAALGDDAFWIPPRLWAYAAENQPDGDFSSYTDTEIAMLVGYSKDATSMLQALLQAGYMDPDRRIHDWAEHNSYHQGFSDRARAAAKVRWDKQKERTKEKEEKTGDERRGEETSIASGMLVASNTTKGRFAPPPMDEVRFQAVKIGLPESEAARFFNYYQSNGWKVGRNPMKDWRAAMTNWKLKWETERGGFKSNGHHKNSSANNRNNNTNANQTGSYSAAAARALARKPVPDPVQPGPAANDGGVVDALL